MHIYSTFTKKIRIKIAIIEKKTLSSRCFYEASVYKGCLLEYERQLRHAPVAKLVDAPDLGSGVERRVGSSPIRRTMRQKRNFRENFPLFYFCNSLIIEQL